MKNLSLAGTSCRAFFYFMSKKCDVKDFDSKPFLPKRLTGNLPKNIKIA